MTLTTFFPGQPNFAANLNASLGELSGGLPSIAADASGVTDATSAILAGLNVARGLYSDRNLGGGALQPGTYKVNALALSQSYQTLEGANPGAVLKAATGAPCVLRIDGKRNTAVRNLTLDGNAKASHGLQIRAAAGGPSSEAALVEHVMIANCDHGIDITEPASGIVTQTDKHTYINTFVNASNVGLYLNAENGQQQTFIGAHFESNTKDVVLVQGGLTMVGGQLGGTGTGIDIQGLLTSGDAMYGIDLTDVIFEGHAVGINGATGWPRLGVTMRGCTIGATECIRMGVDTTDSDGYPPFLTADHCDFATGNVVLDGDNVTFFDYFNRYREGASVQRVGSGCRHIQWNADGLTIYRGNTIVYQLRTSGGLRRKRTVTSLSYTATIDDYYVGVNDTTAARTITLPPAASAGSGFELIVKDESNHAATANITVDGNGSETIDGNLTKVINTNYGVVRLICTGAAWLTT